MKEYTEWWLIVEVVKLKLKQHNMVNLNSDKTFIIAEIGSNHNQSLSLAYETIDAAKDALPMYRK